MRVADEKSVADGRWRSKHLHIEAMTRGEWPMATLQDWWWLSPGPAIGRANQGDLKTCAGAEHPEW